MDSNGLFDTVMSFVNSNVGSALIWAATVGLFMFLASKYNPFREKWKAWEGSIITGIKLAEKEIPDETPNAGLAKLDAALKFVLKAYAEANGGQQPSAKLTQEIKQAIQVKHADLDRLGVLGNSGT